MLPTAKIHGALDPYHGRDRGLGQGGVHPAQRATHHPANAGDIRNHAAAAEAEAEAEAEVEAKVHQPTEEADHTAPAAAQRPKDHKNDTAHAADPEATTTIHHLLPGTSTRRLTLHLHPLPLRQQGIKANGLRRRLLCLLAAVLRRIGRLIRLL